MYFFRLPKDFFNWLEEILEKALVEGNLIAVSLFDICRHILNKVVMINLLENRNLLSLKTRVVNHETKHRCKKKEGKREWMFTDTRLVAGVKIGIISSAFETLIAPKDMEDCTAL